MSVYYNPDTYRKIIRNGEECWVYDWGKNADINSFNYMLDRWGGIPFCITVFNLDILISEGSIYIRTSIVYNVECGCKWNQGGALIRTRFGLKFKQLQKKAMGLLRLLILRRLESADRC